MSKTFLEQSFGEFEKNRKEEEDQFRYLLNDVRQISDSESGLNVLDYFLSICGIYQDAFTEKTLSTIYACGKQAIGKQFLSLLEEADPNIYIKILQRRIKNAR